MGVSFEHPDRTGRKALARLGILGVSLRDFEKLA
jgi:hypothetical protein